MASETSKKSLRDLLRRVSAAKDSPTPLTAEEIRDLQDEVDYASDELDREMGLEVP